MFTKNDKIGSVVVQFPKAAEILKKYQIDFCCGGDRPLEKAFVEQNLNEAEILEQLNSAYAEFKASRNYTDTDWSKQSLTSLVDHIVETHHKYLYENLPAIGELALKILRVHGDKHQELYRIHKLFNALRTELEQHLITEEVELYPVIKQYEISGSIQDLAKIKKILDNLEDEHETAGGVLKELRAITKNFVPPSDVCASYQLTYKKLEELESDIFQHIHLENNILHPRLRKHIETL
ncbi:iron-sulfur cluster repair di-iron protein [Dendrosporobacter sp. 1207_IL3150]|uniref:iron-sulfur cluster repair di-iron protein n=1 Tax=Dendrosporobacter sp. 1207_IL3150 TaxID=3084054 RepID=UPI002FDAF5FC